MFLCEFILFLLVTNLGKHGCRYLDRCLHVGMATICHLLKLLSSGLTQVQNSQVHLVANITTN
jgi:hypothetical protein